MVETGLKAYGYEPDPRRRDLHQVPQDPQPGRLRRLHALDPRGALQPHHHRAAGRLRPRPDHRRLPAGGALRRRPADRGQEGRAGHAGRPPDQRRDHPRPRGARRADQRPGRAGRARRHARPGPPPPGRHRAGGDPVAVLGLPGRDQGAERRGDVPGPHVDLPRRLPAARHRRRASSPSPTPRSWSTTSSSSCGSCGSCAPRSTTRCSPATRPGSPSRSAAWATTAGRWSPGPRSGSCRPCTTWARLPSRT